MSIRGTDIKPCKCGHIPREYQARITGELWKRMVQCNRNGCLMWGKCYTVEKWNALDIQHILNTNPGGQDGQMYHSRM